MTPRCPRCRLLPELCLCADIPTLATRTRIVVVRHASEVSRTSNTGHLAVAALSNSLLVDYGLPGRPLDLRPVQIGRAHV